MGNKIMLVDDDKNFVKLLGKLLNSAGYDTICYTSPINALKDNDINKYGCIVVDLIMPELNGIKFLKEIKKQYPLNNVIVLTGQSSIETAVEAMKEGAYTYLEKPSDIEQIVSKIDSLFDKEVFQSDDSIIGNSPQINEVKRKIKLCAPTDANVLIYGPTGSGKELVAKMIYNNSRRAKHKYTAINCAAIPDDLFVSELFGHKKGSFTGAFSDQKGKLEDTNNGTIFLDEIGELSLTNQSKLLRFIQEKEIQPLGGSSTIKVDVRIICATNRNLAQCVEKKLFRQDLYYRLNVINIDIPSLDERGDDTRILFDLFFNQYNEQLNKNIPYPTDEILQYFIDYPYPGNVRELKNIIKRTLILTQNNAALTIKDLPKEITQFLYNAENIMKPEYTKTKEEFDKNYILKLLNKNNWNITKTAKMLNMSRKNLYLKMQKYNINSKGQ